LGTVLGLWLLWRGGEWALERLVYENKAFALEHLDIQTDGVISAGQLRQWAGLKLGQNLLALDLERVRRDLMLAPFLEFAAVERIPPHTLRIRITEREPIAQANLLCPRPGGGVELRPMEIDSLGYVMPPLDPHQTAAPLNQVPEQLTLLSGLESSELQQGRRIESPGVHAALRLILAFESSPMVDQAELKRIDVSAPGVLTVTTSQGSEITFAFSDLESQLLRWHEIYVRAAKSGRAIASLDLAITNNNPLRLLDASTLPPTGPKTIKSLHLRKKHV
jgi:cell division septal protein FtsQ